MIETLVGIFWIPAIIAIIYFGGVWGILAVLIGASLFAEFI